MVRKIAVLMAGVLLGSVAGSAAEADTAESCERIEAVWFGGVTVTLDGEPQEPGIWAEYDRLSSGWNDERTGWIETSGDLPDIRLWKDFSQ